MQVRQTLYRMSHIPSLSAEVSDFITYPRLFITELNSVLHSMKYWKKICHLPTPQLSSVNWYNYVTITHSKQHNTSHITT